VGRALYSPDHALVEQWVEDQRERLYLNVARKS